MSNHELSCPKQGWEQPIATDTANIRAVRFSRLVIDDRRRYLVGTDEEKRMSGSRTATLFLADSSGRLLGRPPGDFVFAFPVAGIDSRNGTLQLLWGESTESSWPRSAIDWVLQPIVAVWTAEFNLASWEWSNPARLIDGTPAQPIWWVPQTPDLRSQGEHLSTAALLPMGNQPRDRGRSKAVIFRFVRGVWETRIVPLPGNSTQIGFAHSDGNTWMAFVGQVHATSPHNLVAIVRSTDSGATWSEPLVLGGGDRSSPIHGLAVLASQSVVHVLWRESAARDRSVLRHRSVEGTSGEWSPPHDLLIPQESGGETFTIDACGNVHVALEEIIDGSMALSHAVFSGRWSTRETLFPSLSPHSAHLTTSARGEVHLSFLGFDRDVTGAHRLQTFWSRLKE